MLKGKAKPEMPGNTDIPDSFHFLK